MRVASVEGALREPGDSRLGELQRLADESAPVQRLNAIQCAADASAGVGESPPTGQSPESATQIGKAADLGTRGTSQKLPHLDAIQRSFGRHDVGHVQAHLDQQARAGARAMGARAFAFGSHVAFAGKPSLRLAAHEAAHVVQQQAGVQLDGGVGKVGDAHERHADAVAERVVRGESAEALLDACPGGGAPGSVGVQRSVGLEIELRESEWLVSSGTKDEQTGVPEKGTPIIEGKDFEAQAEWSGKQAVLEFVTNAPGYATRDQYNASLGAMVELGQKLDKLEAGHKYDHTDISGMKSGFVLEKKGQIENASLQVTAGVPLDSIPALFEKLGTICPDREEYEKALARAKTVKSKTSGTFSDKRSQAYLGLMTLIQHYLLRLGQKLQNERVRKGRGMAPPESTTFLKGLILVMARTDFPEMFKLLPESDRTYLNNHLDAWRTAMLGKSSGLKMRPGTPLVHQLINDPNDEDPAFKIKTTRREWLDDLMTKDRLTKHGYTTGDVVAKAPKSEKKKKDKDKDTEPEPELIVSKSTLLKQLSQRTMTLTEEETDERDLIAKQYSTLQGTSLSEFPEHELSRLYNTSEQSAVLDSLFMGFGALGTKTDKIKYGSEEPISAPIIELRSPQPALGVSNWKTVADGIYDAIDEAIRYPNGKGPSWNRTAAREYENVVEEKKVEKKKVEEKKDVLFQSSSGSKIEEVEE